MAGVMKGGWGARGKGGSNDGGDLVVFLVKLETASDIDVEEQRGAIEGRCSVVLSVDENAP